MTWEIREYEIPSTDEFEIEMPAISQILKIGRLNGLPHMWVMIKPDSVDVKYKFKAFSNYVPGGPLWSKPPLRTVDLQQEDGSILRYVDSFKHDKSYSSEVVWHLFEVIEGKK